MVLEKGVKSELVKELQTKLNALGFKCGTPDGEFGVLTVEAVKAFQRSKRLVDDGVVGTKTASLLGITLPAAPAKDGTSGSTKFAKLSGVHPDVIKVVELAATKTTMPFIVTEGLRTLARQQRLVKSGASQTLNSKHLPQSGGYGHAVDLAPYFDFDGDGKHELSWHLDHFYPIAEAMRSAAKELGVRIRWGGCWQVLNSTTAPTASLVTAYSAERRKLGKRAFIDCPHFELYTG
jgi:peptidoglycan L-alanyl-D-glutamate endopeptidase CwlK